MTHPTIARSALLLVAALAATAYAAPPPLAPDALPRGIWELVEVGGGPNPWPGAAIQFGVADDGATVLADAGCTRFIGTARRDRTGFALEVAARSAFACDDERTAANDVVLPVFEDLEGIDVVAGRLYVRGAGPVLVYAPAERPSDAGVPGAPPVASSDRLDPTRFARAVEASITNGAVWARDPLQVALLFVAMPSTGRTALVREDARGGGATVVRLWFDDLVDDEVRGRWFEVRLEQDQDGAWWVAAGRQATACAGGEGLLVAGRCP